MCSISWIHYLRLLVNAIIAWIDCVEFTECLQSNLKAHSTNWKPAIQNKKRRRPKIQIESRSFIGFEIMFFCFFLWFSMVFKISSVLNLISTVGNPIFQNLELLQINFRALGNRKSKNPKSRTPQINFRVFRNRKSTNPNFRIQEMNVRVWQNMLF